ncbi:hypothetical protein [Paenibacillus sp. PL91]|uniref:hypothetical protein n=1 Tax=Paenibacillus sp. PL91 TaxID=2729538 RepID=UPI00145CEE98|nr:hypothetical protein [Paenibacillus sp. PL91]MBC9201014.1 hypothetical protein [Paenibacillus sp. PL91]
MSDGSLRAKQEKLKLETAAANPISQTSHPEAEKSPGYDQNAGANPEWRRFYEVIKEITLDLR